MHFLRASTPRLPLIACRFLFMCVLRPRSCLWPGARGTRQSPPKQRYDAKHTRTHIKRIRKENHLPKKIEGRWRGGRCCCRVAKQCGNCICSSSARFSDSDWVIRVRLCLCLCFGRWAEAPTTPRQAGNWDWVLDGPGLWQERERTDRSLFSRSRCVCLGLVPLWVP